MLNDNLTVVFDTFYHRRNGFFWGVNVRRIVKWKNEVSDLTLVPASYGQAGVSQMATAATLVGLETPARSKNLEVKPYGVSSLTTI